MRIPTNPFATLASVAIIAVIATSVFTAGLGLGVGLASTGAESSSEIRGCVNRYTGALRILTGNGECTPSELPLSWDQNAAGGLTDIQTVTNTEVVTTEDNLLFSGVAAECPSGHIAISGGGGVESLSGDDLWLLVQDEPFSDGDGIPAAWVVEFRTLDGQEAEGEYEFHADVICVANGEQ